MKKTLIILALTLFSVVSSFAQSFEGKITYTNTYKSKSTQLSDEQMTAMMGGTQEFSIKGSMYKSVFNGSFMQWQLFDNKDNKVYTKMAGSESAFWNDITVQGDSVLKTEIKRSATTILGYKCDEVILTCRSGVQKYYFSSKLAVDAKLFANHKYGNWFAYLSLAGAVPLKSVIETEQFSLVSVATEIKKMKLDDADFELPAGIVTEKSSF